jgi:hypothetical protein
MKFVRNTALMMATQIAFFGWLFGCVWLGHTFGALYGALAFGIPTFIGISALGAAAMEAGVPFGGMPYLPPMPPAMPPPPPLPSTWLDPETSDLTHRGGLRESGPA